MNPRARDLIAGLAKAKTVPKDEHVAPERFVSALDLGRKFKRTKKADVTVSKDAALHATKTDGEWDLLCRQTFGNREMNLNYWRWEDKWREDPALLRDILGEIQMRCESVQNPAAFAEALWQKAKGRTMPRSRDSG